jgi:hypothetical protein
VEVTTTTPGASSTAPGATAPPAVPTTTVPQSTTGTASSAGTTLTTPGTTTSLPPTTTTTKYCVAEGGMNQPLNIPTSKVTSDDSTVNQPIDINPNSTNPGVTFSNSQPSLTFPLDKSQEFTVLYLPNDRPNQPSNIQSFNVTVYTPNTDQPQTFQSTKPSASSTTTSTPSTGATSTTPSTTTAVVPLTPASPRVEFLPGTTFPAGSTIIITITGTTDGTNPKAVCHNFFSLNK